MAGRSAHGLTPLFFGPPAEALFGCWHAPVERPARALGLVLCPPIGQEYIRAHRAFRQLAARAARQGFHCLRFDWYGCGDSAGEDGTGRVERWQADVGLAIDALRAQSGLREVALVGLRLGATLAAQAASARGDVQALVLWDPVVDGGAFARALADQQRARLRAFPVLVKVPPAGEPVSEVLGFALPEGLRADLERLDLMALAPAPARRTLLVDTGAAAEIARLQRHLDQLGAPVDCLVLDTPAVSIENINKVQVPHAVLQAILAWLGGLAA